MVEYYVVLGDVVHSREIDDREGFQDRLEDVCGQFNATERDDVWGDFKILKGIDEFGGVLQSLEDVYEVVTAFQEALRPHEVRMVVAGGSIDVGLTSWDVEKMDGEAFHRASERLADVEDGPLSFDLLVDDDALARAVADEINLLLHVRGDWTDRQWEVALVRERVDTQTAAAEELGVTQQAVSNVLSGANWPLVHEVEERLRETLTEYADSRSNHEDTEPGGEESVEPAETSEFAVPPEYLPDESDGERFDEASALKMYADDLRDEGNYDEAAEYYERALERDQEYASAHLGYANLLLNRGSLDDAESHYQRALELYRADGDDGGTASSLNGLGLVARMLGDLDVAKHYHEESLAIRQKLDDPRGVSQSLANLGTVAIERGDLDAAEEYHKESLAVGQELGDRHGVALNLGNLGLIARMQGDLDAAKEYHEESLAIEREVGDRLGQAQALGNLGVVAQERGDSDTAEESLEVSLDMLRKIGDRHGQAQALGNLGAVAQKRGDLDAAEEYHEKSLAIKRKLGDRHGVARSLNNLGRIAQERGNLDVAEDYYDESVSISREIGANRSEQTILRNLVEIALERDDDEKATTYLQRSLDIDPTQEALVLAYGELAVEDGRYDDALDRLSALLESLASGDGGGSFVRAVDGRLDTVLEPVLSNASDGEQVESVLSFLVELAERTTGTASDDLEAWALTQYARITGTTHERAERTDGSPELRVSDAYCTALGFLLGEEPANAVRPLKRAWELRDDLDESAVEYATSSGVALLGCADLLGPSVLDAAWADLYDELGDRWMETLRAPARRFFEDAEDGGEIAPEEVAETIQDDDREQFASLEARAFASLVSLLREQAEREA